MPPSRPTPSFAVPGPDALVAAVARVERAVDTTWGRRVLVGLNVLVLLVAIAPFAVWEGFGPARFADVQLGQHPDAIDLDPGDPLASPGAGSGDGWNAADLPFDLSPSTTVTLVFSVGSKDLDPAEAERLRVNTATERGGDGLTDTMMLVVADHETRDVALLSIPRDTWLFDRGHRINATFNIEGLQAFVDDVARTVGLPIHHLVRLNFGAFARLVDAVGGVAVDVDRPLADVPAVLYVPSAGCWQFDGAAALAWSRGRHTLTKDGDGDWVTDRTASDFGRIERQQALLGALWDQVRRPSTIGSLPSLVTAARDGLVVDDGLGVQQVRDLLSVFGEVAAGRVEGYTLPTTGRRIGQAAAQVVVPEAATPIITRLRTWPPAADEPAPSAMTRSVAVDAPEVLAAGTTLAIPGTTACTRDVARPLPDPRPPLGGVAAATGGSGGTTTSDGGTAPADDGAQEPATEGPTSEPTAEPSQPPPSDDTTEPPDDEPSPEPTDTESDDDGGILPPLPGGGPGGG